MARANNPMGQSVTEFLEAQAKKDSLRFITCGSVDDGKSTLIGRLLYDSKMLFDDQINALHPGTDSHEDGLEIDFASLVDGLAAEREQGITIDVAYRYFATDKRRFIVADTPGHEQYTRNMATGASTADAAVVLIDARKGVLTQTRRHSFLLALMRVQHVILAVNKMDLIGYEQTVFNEIVRDYMAFAETLGLGDVCAIPMSALMGANVFENTGVIDWYTGPSLMETLESLPSSANDSDGDFILPVQWVNRPNQDFRGFCGAVARGSLAVGDAIIALPSGKTSMVTSLYNADTEVSSITTGDAATVTLADEIDISRGDVICPVKGRLEISDQFGADIIWMSDQPMLPERPYLIKTANRTVPAVITRLKHKVDVNTMEELAATQLGLNEVGECHIALDQEIPFAKYTDNRTMGSFVIIDRQSNTTVGAGMIKFGLRRAENVHWQAMDVTKDARAKAKGQAPCVLWFTGLSGSGKSTIANIVEQKLHIAGHHTYLLDGDNVRHGLNRDLGFTDADRVENIRRVAEVSKLMTDAGLIVLVSFISPFASERQMARDMMSDGEFIEVFIDTPLEECIKRDVKGLYKKALAGEIKNFTGIDSPYEAPKNAELHIESMTAEPEAHAEAILTWLTAKKYI